MRSNHKCSLKMHVDGKYELVDLELFACDQITEDGRYQV